MWYHQRQPWLRVNAHDHLVEIGRTTERFTLSASRANDKNIPIIGAYTTVADFTPVFLPRIDILCASSQVYRLWMRLFSLSLGLFTMRIGNLAIVRKCDSFLANYNLAYYIWQELSCSSESVVITRYQNNVAVSKTFYMPNLRICTSQVPWDSQVLSTGN